MVKLSQIEEYKKPFKKAVFCRAWGLKRTHGGILRGCPPLRQGSKWRSPSPLLEFARLQGARK